MAANEKILRYKIAGAVDASVTRTANDVINAYSKIDGITVKQKRAVDALAKSNTASAAATVKSAQAELTAARAGEVRSRTAERTAKSVSKINAEINRQIETENRAARQSQATGRQVERDYDRRAKAIEKSYDTAIKAARRADAAQSRGGGLRSSIAGGIKDAAISSLPFAGVAAAAQFAGEEIKKATGYASDLNETIQKSEQIFGRDNAAGIAKWAEGAAKTMGLAKGEAIEATAVFGNLFRVAGITGSESADLSKQIAQLAGDLASFNNADPSQVLQNLQSGLNGEAEPLRKFGIFLDESRVKAEAFADGIAKPVKDAAKIRQAHQSVEIAVAKLTQAQKKYGEGSLEAASAQRALDAANTRLEKALQGSGKELTQQEKLLARIQIVLKDSALAQGDYARTAMGAANSERTLNAELKNLETRLGGKLLPARLGFVRFLSDIVETGDKSVNIVERLGNKLERIANLPVGQIDKIMNAIGWAAFGGPQRLAIDLLDKNLRQRSQNAAVNASPGGQMSSATNAANLIAQAKRTNRSSPELLQALRSLGVDTKLRGYPGEFQAMLDHGTVEARNRMAVARTGVNSDMQSRLLGAYLPAKPLPAKKPSGMQGGGDASTTGGNDLYSGADRNAAARKAESDAEEARKKAKKDAEEAAKATMDDLRAATHETLEGYVDYLQNALKAALNTFENKLPENKLTDFRKGIGSLLDDVANAQRAVARATYRDDTAKDPKNTMAAQAKLDRALKGIKQDRVDASGDVDKAQQAALKRIAEDKKKEADKLQERLEFESEQFQKDKKEREERQSRLRKFAEDEIRLMEGVRDSIPDSDFDTLRNFTKKILEREQALASSDFFGGLLSGDTDRMMAGLLRSQSAKGAFKSKSFEIAKNQAEANDTYTPPLPTQRSSVLSRTKDAAFSQAGDMIWSEATNAGERMASGFLENLVSGRGRRGGMKDLLKDVAQDAGRSLAQQAGSNLMREIERPLMGLGKDLGKYLELGGKNAGEHIVTAAASLYGIAAILGTQGKKKQKGGILGGIVGGIIGAVTGTGWAAAAGIGAGAGASLLGGLFANGGTAPGRRISMFGERGPELGVPEQDMRIFTAEQTANLYAAANGGGSRSRGGNTNHFYIEKVDNRAGVDQIRQMMEDDRQREAYA